jgi:hypothetical protein
MSIGQPGVRWLLAIATRLAVLSTLLAVVSLVPLHPISLLEHFRLQLLLGSAGIAATAAALRLAGWFDIAALCALLDRVRNRWIGPDIGSDHLPVVIDLVVPRE